ncbi:MAG: hypothetical protein LLF83_06770 [Methanobacterium sp.]|nr:hypothetical protein [Methanobacterium sp.]
MKIYGNLLLVKKDHSPSEGTLAKAWSLDKGLLEEYQEKLKDSELYSGHYAG